uniref:ATP synthase alpha subunit C-terminal domain-containing protein n=1 Tax=Haptolina ericina TaxID=156174 RepID=A0A7S3F354_9EUKA|mmetsp:Transcript_4643/g.10024  ORF Transcript_4643/g.10024 Transcript_4643/m.10024 type:complete len:204 (+) Transcript_4643:238-849(+)|eukprot:CAMPEP_0181202626 /NCGR_PEP_ID=MMETSP1096-20121128/18951_1 /TAXON_ID=156174 ORGANISM="Chrysochromulina ericina, Strain CCMP281" /NCGR_SAMPLE_ID=MMETSP1096 /ASSEMBLY_ACC=CAM_ASM_000453 /LENGTH=203 /DNA_ID=CAMNT_0023293169 /DNA_START=312 /DNA_END=923 /DNA_ORIENTATION=-
MRVRPAALLSDSIARVGAGSEISASRASPSTPAMRRVAQALRLELAQARDLLPPAATDSIAVRTQRTRAGAVEAVLCNQWEGAPLRLSHQLVLLHCLMEGHLDHLAAAGSEQVRAETSQLLQHVEAHMAARLQSVDKSGTLDAEGERMLLECAAEVLPAAVGKAFFTNWDPNYAYDTSKATPVPLSSDREGTVSKIISERVLE